MASKLFNSPARCRDCGTEFTIKEWGKPWKCNENYSCEKCAREQRKSKAEQEKMHAKMQLQDKAIELERIKAKQKRYEMKYQKYQLMLLNSGKKRPPGGQLQPADLSNNSTSSISTFTTINTDATFSSDSDFEDDENCTDNDAEQ